MKRNSRIPFKFRNAIFYYYQSQYYKLFPHLYSLSLFQVDNSFQTNSIWFLCGNQSQWMDFLIIYRFLVIYKKGGMEFGKQQVKHQREEGVTHFRPFMITDSSTLTPDNPQFFKFDLNLCILTKYGRYIYIRHGNEQRCSSFFATLCTIVNKLQLSFGTQQQPGNLKKICQGKLTFYVLRRQNFMYICWTKLKYSEIIIYSMIEYLHYQLRSSLTERVNQILQENQTYDPTVNFGRGRAIYNMFHYAIMNGLYSLPVLFTAIPPLVLKQNVRNMIHTFLKSAKQEQQGLLVSMLMTMSHLISIWKRKSVDFTHNDYLLLCNLLQTNSNLCKTENWFPICLPGMQASSMVFCYLNFHTPDIIHIMISDESDKFAQLSHISKQLKHNMQQNPITLSTINSSLQSPLKSDPSLQRVNMFHHFIAVDLQKSQFIQSSGNNFGFNPDKDYLKYLSTYGELYEYYLKTQHNRKEKLHTQTLKDFLCGYYEDGAMLIMVIMSVITDLEQCKSVISSILKFVKDQENNLWLHFPK